MNDKKCFICKNCGKDSDNRLFLDYLYDQFGNTQTIPLCYVHSVEFFKVGQKQFVAKYSCLVPVMEDFKHMQPQRAQVW